MMYAPVVEHYPPDATTMHDLGYQNFKELRNRAAREPGNVTLELIRGALLSTKTVSFQAIFGGAYDLSLGKLKSILQMYREDTTYAFQSAIDGGWGVAIWPADVESAGTNSEFANPEHVYNRPKNTLETTLRGLDFQIPANIFAEECDTPIQATPNLFGAWAKKPKAEDARGKRDDGADHGAGEGEGDCGGGTEGGRQGGEGEGGEG